MRNIGDHRVKGDFHFALHAKNFKQDGDAFARRHYAADDGPQSAKWSRYHVDLFTDFYAWLDDDCLLILHRITQLADNLRSHSRGNISKGDDLDHPTPRANVSVLRYIPKPGENVARKHGLGYPKLARAASSLETYEWTKHLDPSLYLEHVAGDSLVPRLRPQAIPFEIVCHVVSVIYVFSRPGSSGIRRPIAVYGGIVTKTGLIANRTVNNL